MTPEASQYSEPVTAGLSEAARITGVFFEPSKAFEDVAARPRWIVPLALIILSVCAMMAVFSQRVGFETMVREQMERNPRVAQLPAEQREAQIAIGARFGPIMGYAGSIVGFPLMYLVIAAVLLGIAAGMFSAPVKFKQVFAIVCYSGLPAILSSLLAIVVIFLKGSEFNLQNPLMFNPAAAMDPLATSKFLYSLLSSIDLFSFWMIFLIATGLHAAGGKKLPFGKALFAVVLPWAVYVLGKSSMAGMFA